MGDHSERVAAEEDGAAARCQVGGTNALPELRFKVLAALLLAEAAGNEDDRFGLVVLDKVGDDRRHLGSSHRNHEEIDLGGQIGHARHTGRAVDRLGGRMHDVNAGTVKTGIKEIVEDDPAHVSAVLGDPDDGRRFGLEEVSDLVDGPRSREGGRRSERAHAVQRRHPPAGGGKGVDLHLLDMEPGLRVGRGEVVCEIDEGLEALDEDGVLQQTA